MPGNRWSRAEETKGRRHLFTVGRIMDQIPLPKNDLPARGLCEANENASQSRAGDWRFTLAGVTKAPKLETAQVSSKVYMIRAEDA